MSTPTRGRGRARARMHQSVSPRPVGAPGASGSSSPDEQQDDSPRFPNVEMAGLAIDPQQQQGSSGSPAVQVQPQGEPSAGLTRGTTRGPRKDAPQTFVEHEHVEHLDDYQVVTRPSDLKVKTGSKGTSLKMISNYFMLKRAPLWSLHEYRMDSEPSVDPISAKKALLRFNQEKLGSYIFDGTKMYTARVLDESLLVFDSKIKEGDYKVILKYIGPINRGNPTYFQFFNLILRRCLFGMGLEEMGRHFYDHTAAIDMTQQRLSLWPGYVTSLRQHEHEVLLCIETTHKVLRMDNVNVIMKQIKQNSRQNPVEDIQKQLKDTIIMTSYNRKTYKIKDIDFTMTPMDTFETKKGITTYVEYYKNRYQKEITDMKQPMVRCEPSKKDKHRGLTGDVILPPELCQLTGLTDQMRENFSLMKELGKHLHMGPQDRVREIYRFIERLYSKDDLTASLDSWGLKFEKKLVGVEGRTLPSERIMFSGGDELADNKGDWTKAFRSQKMLTTVNLTRWVVIVPQRDASGVDNLARTMSKVSAPLNMRIGNPTEVVQLNGVGGPQYKDAIGNVLQKYPDLQMLFVILPNNKPDTYGVVKKRLAVEAGVLSQCFVAKNVTSKGLMSIATKVVVQMNAKLGGEPWTIKLPLKKLMIVGFDVYHGAKGAPDRSATSVGAMVATLTPTYAKYFSCTSYFNRGKPEELSTAMKTDFTKCIRAFQEENNGELPDRIVLFRDGVGEGQLQWVCKSELKQIQEAMKHVYDTADLPPPKFTFIVVTKKINTRIMSDRGGKYDNPPPGTVVDDIITIPERYDFFLVSCTARQGTVSPCSYNVLFDSQGLDPDKLQMLTYKMCHMYFNWSGTVAVPAPCQYAHKLAFITGVSYSGHANKKLSQLLHFL